MEKPQRKVHQKRQRRQRQRRLFLGFIFLLVILLIFGAIKIFGKSKSPSPMEEPNTSLENPPMENASDEGNTSKDSSTLLEKTKSYSDTMYLSKVELYNHLLEEKFNVEEIRSALEELRIDYKKNALLRAREYQKNMNMSPDAIYEKLVGEFGDGFTPDEGQYALDNL